MVDTVLWEIHAGVDEITHKKMFLTEKLVDIIGNKCHKFERQPS